MYFKVTRLQLCLLTLQSTCLQNNTCNAKKLEKKIHGLHFASVNVTCVMEQEELSSMRYLQVPSHRWSTPHVLLVLQGQGRWRVLRQLHIHAAQSGWDSCDGKGEGVFSSSPLSVTASHRTGSCSASTCSAVLHLSEGPLL